MAYSKLPYVKGSPLLAKPRLYSGDPIADIWSVDPMDPNNIRISNSRFTLNGVLYGEEITVPAGSGGGMITCPAVLKAFDKIDFGADSGYEQRDKTNFSGAPAMLDLRINDAAIVLAGSTLIIGQDPTGTLMEITGGNTYYGVDYGVPGDDLPALKTKLVTILNAAMAPGEPLNGIITLASPSSDNLPDYVQIHLEGDVNCYVSSNEAPEYIIGVPAALEEVNIEVNGNRNFYLVLATLTLSDIGLINKKTVFFAEVPVSTAGYNSEIDAVYDKVSNIGVQGIPTPPVVTIDAITLAFTPPTTTGDRYSCILRDNFSNDSGFWLNDFDGTGFGIDIFDEQKVSHATSYTLGVDGFAASFARAEYGTDQTIPEKAWEVEFDYDVSRVVTTNTTAGGPPACPMGMYMAMDIEGTGPVGPLFDGLGVGALVVKGSDKTQIFGFDYSGDGPATSEYIPSSDIGRIKITHDGSGGYEWFISYNNGTSWTSMFTTSGVTLPTGYEAANKGFRFGGICVGATGNSNTDIRMDNVIFRKEVDGVAIYDSLADINNDFNYVVDMVGFSDGAHNFTGIDFETATVYPVSGNFCAVDAGSIKAGLANFNGHDTRIFYSPTAYYPFDGTEDITALAVSIDSLPVYLTMLVKSSDVAAATAYFLAHGATAVDVIKSDIFVANGLNEDYTWSFTPPIPPTPTPSETIKLVDSIDREMIDDVLMADNY